MFARSPQDTIGPTSCVRALSYQTVFSTHTNTGCGFRIRCFISRYSVIYRIRPASS